MESPRPCAPGIEVKDTAARLLLWHVAVARYDGVESRRFRFQIQFGEVVQDINGNAADFDHLGLRQRPRPSSLVDVAAHDRDRRDRGEASKNFRCTDIAGMNDVLGASQLGHCFRPKQSVCVGDDADKDRSSQSADLSSWFLVLDSWFLILGP